MLRDINKMKSEKRIAERVKLRRQKVEILKKSKREEKIGTGIKILTSNKLLNRVAILLA